MSSRPREISMNRRLEIKLLIEEIGLWNINRQSLADKYGISRQMVDKDIHAIMIGMPAEDLKEIQFNIKNAYKKALRELQRILATSAEEKNRINAAKGISEVGARFTEMLENYGLKERIAERVDIRSVSLVKNVDEVVERVQREGREVFFSDFEQGN